MKYAVLADIHSNLQALQAVLAKTSEMGVDKYICLGDVVGYNANPRECLEVLRELNPEAVIRGNHDEYAASDSPLTGFNPQAAHVVKWTRNHLNESEKEWLRSRPYQYSLNTKVMLVHATLDMPSKWGYIFDKWHAAASFNYQRTQVCFFGHTHLPIAFDKFGGITTLNYRDIELEPAHKYLVNVGSVGQPRDGDPRASFAVYDQEEHKISLHRVEYDIEACQQAIYDADLPERCAMRLVRGR
ncbi:MAG: metallophosphoesterase family protein [Lentisphaeria bacterium]